MLTFMEGTYEVIGKYPENGRIYTGAVKLARKDHELMMVREIKGKKVFGKAKIVTATADAVPVLQANFTEGKDHFQITYIIGSDLDNYARLSAGYIMREKKPKKPGMETLFIFGQMQK